MPKRVDHQDRRRAIAEAVFQVIGERGYEAASLRDVAAEAGISMGRVQHYFTSKHEMLLFALSQMRQRVLARLQSELEQVHTASGSPSHRDLIRAGSRAMLPITPESRQEARVNVAFVSASSAVPEYADLLREGYERLLAASKTQLRTAAEAGEIRAGLDLDHEAATFFYLIQGLIGPLLLGVCTPDEALTIIDQRLDRIFTEPGLHGVASRSKSPPPQPL